MTEKLSVLVHRSAVQMYEGNPQGAAPRLEDFSHLDAAASLLPIAVPMPAVDKGIDEQVRDCLKQMRAGS